MEQQATHYETEMQALRDKLEDVINEHIAELGNQPPLYTPSLIYPAIIQSFTYISHRLLHLSAVIYALCASSLYMILRYHVTEESVEDIETKNREKNSMKELEAEKAALQGRVQELEMLYGMALPELKSLRHRVNNSGKDEAAVVVGSGKMDAGVADIEEMEEELDYLRRQGNSHHLSPRLS